MLTVRVGACVVLVGSILASVSCGGTTRREVGGPEPAVKPEEAARLEKQLQEVLQRIEANRKDLAARQKQIADDEAEVARLRARLGSGAAAADWVVTEHLVLKAEDARLLVPGSFATTVDGRHSTCLVKKGEKAVRLVDGKEAPGTWVHRRAATPGRFGEVMSPVWHDKGPVFIREGSPDELVKQAVDALRDYSDKGPTVVWDDEGRPLAAVGRWRSVIQTTAWASAYAAGAKDFVAVESTPYKEVRELQVRGAAGRPVLAGVTRGPGGKDTVLVDGKEHGSYDRIHSVRLSEDGKVAACLATHEGKVFAVVVTDGKSKEGKKFDRGDNPWSLGLYDGGKHVVFAMGGTVVVDGKAHKVDFDGPYEVGFRPDGTPVVGNYRTGPLASPDGTRVAQWIFREGKWLILLDGKDHGEGWGQGQPELLDFAFSPDSRRLLAFVRDGGVPQDIPVTTVAVLDGKRHGPYAAIRTQDALPWDNYQPAQPHAHFSPDSRSWAFLMKKKDRDNDGWQLVLDGRELPAAYDDVGPTDTHVGFTPDNRFTFLAQRDGAWYFVEAKRK